jgi:hypothetical protein
MARSRSSACAVAPASAATDEPLASTLTTQGERCAHSPLPSPVSTRAGPQRTAGDLPTGMPAVGRPMMSVSVYLPADVAEQDDKAAGQADAQISRNGSEIGAAIPQPEDWDVELGLPPERRRLGEGAVRSIKIREDPLEPDG